MSSDEELTKIAIRQLVLLAGLDEPLTSDRRKCGSFDLHAYELNEVSGKSVVPYADERCSSRTEEFVTVYKDINAYDQDRIGLSTSNARGVVISTDNCSPGYVKLQLVSDEGVHPDTFLDGNAIKSWLTDPHSDTKEGSESKVTPTLKCSFWPEQAQEWIDRNRKWLNGTIVTDIVENGCYLTPDKENMWRYSFEYAEDIIYRNFTTEQRVCFELIKMIHREFLLESSCLPVDVIYAVIYWEYETSTTVLKASELPKELNNLLNQTIKRISEGIVPCYFIPANNKISGLTEDERKLVCFELENVAHNLLPSLSQVAAKFLRQSNCTELQTVLDYFGLKELALSCVYKSEPDVFTQILGMDIEEGDSLIEIKFSLFQLLALRKTSAPTDWILQNLLTNLKSHCQGQAMLEHQDTLLTVMLSEITFALPKSSHTFATDHIVDCLRFYATKSENFEVQAIITIVQLLCRKLQQSELSLLNICELVCDSICSIEDQTHVMAQFLRSMYNNIIDNVLDSVDILEKMLTLDPLLMKTRIRLTKPALEQPDTDKFNSQYFTSWISTTVDTIQESKASQEYILYAYKDQIDDLLLFECEYNNGRLDLPIGLIITLIIVNNTRVMEKNSSLVLSRLQKSQTASQSFIQGCVFYISGLYTRAKKQFIEALKRKPDHIGSLVLGMLCDSKRGFFIPQSYPACKPGQVSCGMKDINYALNIFSLLDDEELALLFSIMQTLDNSHAHSSFLTSQLARRLSISSFLSPTSEMELNYSDMAEKLYKHNSGPVSDIHYITHLWKNNRFDTLELVMDGFEASQLSDGEEIVFHYTEVLLLPDVIADALTHIDIVGVSAELYLLYIKADMKQARVLFEKSDSSCVEALPPILQTMETTDPKTFSARLNKSMSLGLAASVLFHQCRYEDARSMFINAQICSPVISQLLYDKIRLCEDKLMHQTLAFLLQRNFSEAYDTYKELWKKSLPRCESNCSCLLHISEELLDFSKEGQRVLLLCIEYLEYILGVEDSTDNQHEAHAQAVLACLQYNAYADHEDPTVKLQFFQDCVKSLQSAAGKSKTGSLLTHLASVLFLHEKHEDALDVLIEVISEESVEPDVEILPHSPLAETAKFRIDDFLPVDNIFKTLVCWSASHYESYEVYAFYLLISCKFNLGYDISEDIDTIKTRCATKGEHCSGMFTVSGLANINTRNYTMAAKDFSKAFSCRTSNEKPLKELFVLSQCCAMLEVLCSSDELEELVSGWLFALESADKKKTDIPSTKLQTYEAIEPLSLAMYMTAQLPKYLDLNDMNCFDKAMEVYKFIQNELSGIDHLVDGMSTNVAIMLSEKFSRMEDGPEKNMVAEQTTEAFERALSSLDVTLTTTRLAYAAFLMDQGKTQEVIECCESAAEISREVVGDILARSIDDDEELTEEDDQMVNFYVQKCLLPASDFLVIGHTLMNDFVKVFEVTDTLLAFLLRAQDLDVDPVAYLMKYTVELPQFGASIALVISFHEAVIERYPASRFIPTIYNNLGCMLFVHSRTTPDDQEGNLEKAKSSFQEALEYEDATMAIYTDYVNFLYNTEQYETALTAICESDSLPDGARGTNAYGKQEMACVDQCIRQITETSPSGKFVIDSHFYIQYLRVAVLIALKKEVTFIESEINLLLEDGEEKGIECTKYMCEYLKSRLISDQ